MPTTVTEREIRSRVNGHRPSIPNAAVSTRAGARVPATKSHSKPVIVSARRRVRQAGATARRWWLWTSRPVSLRVMWRLSAVDPKRIPHQNATLAALWRISNSTDRLVMLALALACPTFLTGPLRWIAIRPTRRAGFYLLTAVLIAYIYIARHTGKG